MEEVVYQNTVGQRGTKYIIQVIKKDNGYFLKLSLASGEKIREAPIELVAFDEAENFSAAASFREITEAEERWIADNR